MAKIHHIRVLCCPLVKIHGAIVGIIIHFHMWVALLLVVFFPIGNKEGQREKVVVTNMCNHKGRTVGCS